MLLNHQTRFIVNDDLPRAPHGLAIPALVGAATLILAGCEGTHAPIVAVSYELATAEDTALHARVGTLEAGKSAISFRAATPTKHGRLALDSASGAFTYIPDDDYFGMDGFTYLASDGRLESVPASVSIFIAPVQDAPRVLNMPEVVTSSPDEYPTRAPLTLLDVDGDTLHIEAISTDTEIVSVSIDAETGSMLLSPRLAGTAEIQFSVADSYQATTGAFRYESRPVETVRSVQIDPADASVLDFENVADFDVQFQFDVNGHMQPGTRSEVVDRIAQKSNANNEPLLLAIWRTLAENTRRGATLSEATWLHGPVRLLNSLGFGYCDDVASAYSLLARAAGYETRVWTLGGHVVPEVLVDGRWEMFDPDVGVVYRNIEGQIAGVEELVANPMLIANPVDPILAHKVDERAPFSQELADIYSTSSDNLVYDIYTQSVAPSDSTLTLPPGGRLRFGGNWTGPFQDAPTGQIIPFIRQAQLELPAGWTGDLPSAFVIVLAEGAGSMGFGTAQYEIGSTELTELLSDVGRPQVDPRILRSDGPITITILVNSFAGSLREENDVMLSGLNVGAIQVQEERLD
jgi:hypothetical protein